VILSSVDFDPPRLEFALGFKTGVGKLRVTSASPAGTRLEVTLPRSSGSAPFAALRSMFVLPEMADTAEIVLNPGRRVIPILASIDERATEADFVRATPSRHNTSAPDLSFNDFAR
jgi:hypothetical protein